MQSIYSLESTSNQPTSWLIHCWNTFGSRTSRGRPQTHKTHHGPNWGKPPPSPIQYFLRLSARHTSEWLFVPGLPKGSLEIGKVWTFTTLRNYNSSLRPPIRVRSKAKLQLLLRAFQQCVARHLHAQGSGRFLTFYDWESNCQFDSQPFFLP